MAVVDDQHRQAPPSVERHAAIPRQHVFHILAQLASPLPPIDDAKPTADVPDVKPPQEAEPEPQFDVKNALVGIVKAIREYKHIRAHDDRDVEPLDLDAKVFSDAPDEPPSGGAVLVNALVDEPPVRIPFIPSPYDLHDNPSMAALLRALPTNISRRQNLLNHAAEKVDQELFNEDFLPALEHIDSQVEQYGLPVDPKAAQEYRGYLRWASEADHDDWLLAYAPFIGDEEPQDSTNPEPYEYGMFLMKGPGYAQDTFFIIGNRHPNASRAHFLPPLPVANTQIRVFPPNMKVLNDVISMLRRERLYVSGIRVPDVLMQNRWIYTHDKHGNPIYRLPMVEQLFSAAIALANRIDRSAVEIDYPFYIPRYIMWPVYPLVKRGYLSSDSSSDDSSSDDNSWDMKSDASDYDPQVASARSSANDLSSPFDSFLDKQPFKADKFAARLSKIPFNSDPPAINIRIVTHPREPTSAMEFNKIPPGETLPPSRASVDEPITDHDNQEPIPMQCVRIRGSEDHGEQLYYYRPDQLRQDDFPGIIGYGKRADDLSDNKTYFFLHLTTSHDAHERIAYRSVNSFGAEVINYVPVPHTPYALNASRRLTLDHHYVICNFLAYLEGIPIFENGIPILAELTNEYIRTGMDNSARIHQRYPLMEEFIATILLYLHHQRLHTNKCMKSLDELQPLVSPMLPRQLNPMVPLSELQPTRLPYYPARFLPFEPKDPLDDRLRLHYTGCLNRLNAFKLLNFLPKFSTTLGLATAATTELLVLQEEHPVYPDLPIDDDINWSTLTHPFEFHDLFYGETPDEVMRRVRSDDVYHSSWTHHIYYLVNCRRQINMLLELYESFFRAIGFQGFRDVCRQVPLNTTIQNFPAIFTFTEAVYFTALYDFLLREHHFALAREVLALLNVPFSGAFDIMLLRQYIINEIVPPTTISTMANLQDDSVDDGKDIPEEDEQDE